MPRYANREMLTPSPSGRGGRGCADSSPEWGEGTVVVRYDDGSGRVARVRPRTMNAAERRDFEARVDRISRAHAEDLQALADI